MSKAPKTDAVAPTAVLDPIAAMMQQLGSAAVASAVSPAVAPEAAVVAQRPSAVLIEVPVSPDPPLSEFTVHIDIKLSPPQATTARLIAAELDRKQMRLRNGQRITSPSAALKWILEQIEDGLA